MSEICIEKKNFCLKKFSIHFGTAQCNAIFRSSKSLEPTPKTKLYVQNAQRIALVIYLIPCPGIKWSYFVQGFLELNNVHFGAIGEDVLNFLGLGIKKSLNQKGVRPTADERFKQTKATSYDLFARTVIVRQDIETFSVIVVHSDTILPKRVAQKIINQFKTATVTCILTPTTVAGTLCLGHNILGPTVKIVSAFQGERICIQSQNNIT